MSEIGDSAQIIKVIFEGTEITFRLLGGGIKNAVKLLNFIKGLLIHEKMMGETSLRKLLERGGDLSVLSFDEKDWPDIKKQLKKGGVLFSELPDINSQDGKKEIAFNVSSTPLVNHAMKKILNWKLENLEDYYDNGIPEERHKFEEYAEKEKSYTPSNSEVSSKLDEMLKKVVAFTSDKDEVSVEDIMQEFGMTNEEAKDSLSKLSVLGIIDNVADNGKFKVTLKRDEAEKNLNMYFSLASKLKESSKEKVVDNNNYVDITIDSSMFRESSDHAIKTRIPFYRDKYIWISNDLSEMLSNNKTLMTKLDLEKEYKIYDIDNKVIATMKGKDLYKNHYDQVKRRELKQKKEQKIENPIIRQR